MKMRSGALFFTNEKCEPMKQNVDICVLLGGKEGIQTQISWIQKGPASFQGPVLFTTGAHDSMPLLSLDLYSYSRSKLTDYFRSSLTSYVWWKHSFQCAERQIPAWAGSLLASLFRVMRMKINKINVYEIKLNKISNTTEKQFQPQELCDLFQCWNP